MKKLYLFILLIVLGLSQSFAVNATTHTLITREAKGPSTAQTITFTPFVSPQIFGAADITLTATATSGLPVTFTSSNTAVATIVGTTGAFKIHLTGVSSGAITITASQGGDNAKYLPAPNVSLNLVVNAGPQAVLSAFPSTSTALQSADIALPAVSTYPIANFPNNPIIYSITSSSGNVATIVNNRLRLLGTGTVTIAANQSGNGNFPNAATLSATYTITAPAAPVFSTSLAGKVVGGADVDPAATIGGWVSTITYTSYLTATPAVASTAAPIVNNKIRLLAPVTAGTVTISASYSYPLGTGGTATTTATTNTTLVIAAPTPVTSPVINFTALGSKAATTVDFSFTPTTLNSTSTSTSPITLTSDNTAVATIVNGNIHFVGATGVAHIVADQGGVPAGIQGSLPADVSNTLTVTVPVITFAAPAGKVVNSPDFAPAITSSNLNLPITLSSATPATATIVNGNVHLTGVAGSVTIEASQNGDVFPTFNTTVNGLIPADVQTTFTVGAAAALPTLSFAGTTPILGFKPFTNTDFLLINTATGFVFTTNSTLAGPPITFTSSNPNVATIVNGSIHFVGAPPSNNTTIITASQGGGVTGSTYPLLPADLQQVLTVTAPVISFPTLGTKAYSAVDLAPGASSTSGAYPVYYTSSNPAVASITNTITGTITGGTGYTNGTYNGVALTGGSGTGAVAATMVVAGGIVTSFTVNSPTYYAIGDVLTLAAPIGSGGGSGFVYTVTGITSVIHYNRNVPASPNNTTIITATQNGGAAGIPYGYISGTGAITAGSGYTNGTYTLVPLTGGSGTGAVATVIVSGGAVSSVNVTFGGSAYAIGDVLSCTAASIGGTGTGFSMTVPSTAALAADVQQVLTVTGPAITFPALGTKQFTTTDLNPNATGAYLSIGSITSTTITAGSGYTVGTYYNVPLTGGTGTAATANITVVGGLVTSAIIVNAGYQYSTSNVLTVPAALIGGTGSGFSMLVSGISTSLPVTYTSSNPAVATIVNGYIHFVGAPAAPNNTTIITASQSGPPGISYGTLALPAPVPQTLTVTAPTITFNPLGTKTYSATDLNPGATSTVNNLITYTSSNTAVATINNSGIATLNKLVNGTGYTSGTYIVPLSGGTGTGATAQVIVGPVPPPQIVINIAAGTTTAVFAYGVTSVNILSSGSGYTVGDVLTVPAASLNSTTVPPATPATGFQITVGSVGSFVHYLAAGTTNIIASQGGGATGTLTLPADVTQPLTVIAPVITFAPLQKQTLPAADINPGAVSTLTTTPITYTSSDQTIAKVLTNSITNINIGYGGIGYVLGTYLNVPMTGGTGTGATATISVVGGTVSSISVVSGGTGYTVGDVLTTPATNLGGVGTGFTASVVSAGGALHFLSAGTANITASQGGGATGSGTLPADVVQPITVSPFAITFPTLGTKTLTDVDYPLTATSTNTTANITYTSSNTAVASIGLGGVIHYVAAGTATITASQGGGAAGTAVLPADVPSTLTVASPTLTFTSVLGAKTTLSPDFSPGAVSTLTKTAIKYTSSNTAVATIITGSIITVGTIGGGVNYQSGTYPNVPLIGGSGSGAIATITVVGGQVATVAITTGGTGYVTNDVISASTANLGGVGTGFSFTVANAGPVAHIVGAGTTVIEATQQNSAVGVFAPATATLPADISQSIAVTVPTITLPALGTKAYSNVDFNPGATSPVTSVPITYTSSNAAVATIASSLSLSSGFNIGAGYVNGTYPAVALTGGSGTGAIATITVANNAVASVTVTTSGTGYVAGNVLSAPASKLGGAGSGFSIPVNGYVSLIHYNVAVPAAPNNTTTITASQGGGATGTNALPANASSLLTVTAPAIIFPALGSVAYANTDINPGATSSVNLPITYTSGNTAVATINALGQIHMINAGTAIITASQGGGASGLPGIPPDATSTLTVTGGPAITFAATATAKYGTTDIAPGATSNLTTVPITYTSSAPTIASIVGGNIRLLTGPTPPATSITVNITASQGGGAAGTATLPKDVVQTLTINSPLITFTNTQLPTPKTISSVDVAPGATSTVTNVPITYTSNDLTIATITAAGNIHFVGNTGTVKITASQGGGAAGTALLPPDVAVTVVVNAPAITFTAPGSKAFSVIDFTPVATSSLSTLPITFTSNDPTVATIVNGNIHYVGLGTTTIVASQSAAAIAAGLAAPPDVAQTLTVTAPTLTFSTALGSKAYNSSDLALISATTANNFVTSTLNLSAPITFSSSDPTVATIVNNQLHYVGIGSTVITATQAAYGNVPAPAAAITTLTVTPAVITAAPTASLGTLPINTPDAVLAYTSTLSTSAVPVTYTSSDPTIATVVGGLLHFVAPGTCFIIGSQITSANYQPIPVQSTVTVTAIPPTATPTISFPALGTKQFSNNGDIAPGASSTNSIIAINYTSSNPAVATIVAGNIHFTPPSIVNGVVTYPSPNTTTITASQGGGIYGIPGSLPADVSNVLTVTPAGIIFPPLGVQKFSTTDLPPGATSTYTIINASNIAQPIVYTTSDPTVATIVNGNIHFVGLGSVTITASLGNVIVPDVSQNMVVVAPAINFPTTASKVYTTADVIPGAISTLTSVPITYTSSNPTVATIVNNNIHFTGIGVTTIIASQVASGNSTTPLNAAQTLTVTAPTITFAATRTLAYSTTDVDPGGTSTLATVPITYTSSNPALVSIVNGRLHFNIPTSPLTSNTAVITATQAGASNIPVQTALQTLTVTQAILFPNALVKPYGDPDFSPAVSTFGSTFPITYSSATTGVITTVNSNQALHIVAPGTSVITASQVGDIITAAASNNAPTITIVQAPMTITPKNVTINFATTAVPVLPLNYFGFKAASGGLPLDDSTKFTTQPTVYVNGRSLNGNFSALPVGTYTLTVAGAVSTLYTFTYGTGTLTVVSSPQTLTWLPGPPVVTTITKSYGTPDFDPLARSTGDPIVYTSSDPTVATIVNGFVHIVAVGTCTITATLNPTSGNFTGSAVLTKTLIVVPGTQTISVNNIPALIRNAAPYTPVATATSGLPVAVSVTDPSFVTIVNGNIVPQHIGTTLVTFSQPGNANWAAATPVQVYVNVIDPNTADLIVHQAVSPDGDGVNDFLYIEGITNFPVNHVKIIDRNGGNVFETDNYDNKSNVFTGKSSHNGNKLPAGTYFYIVDYQVGNQRNHVTGYFVLKY